MRWTREHEHATTRLGVTQNTQNTNMNPFDHSEKYTASGFQTTPMLENGIAPRRSLSAATRSVQFVRSQPSFDFGDL
jgi:hypothetical protein